MRNVLLTLILCSAYFILAQDYGWKEVPDFPSLERDDSVSFVIDGKVYCGSGNHSGFSQSNRFFAFDYFNFSWSEMATFP